MYNLYPITSLKDWYQEYGNLLKEKDIWKNQEWVLFHHKMISEYLKKEIIEKEGISFAPFVMESVEPSFFFWLSRLISQEENQVIAQERTLFILLYLANKKLNILEVEGKSTFNLLQKTANLFFYYEREKSPILKEWQEVPLKRENLTQEEKNTHWQQILWQYIFLEAQRSFLSLGEALKALEEKEITKEDFPFSSLLAFTDYNLNEDVLSFLLIMEKKGWNTHHIAFLPSFYAIMSTNKIRPFFYENWIRPYYHLREKIKKIPKLKEQYSSLKSNPNNLLGYLKQILKEGMTQEEKPFISSQDNSFLLIEALTPLREIEILSDKILESLKGGTLLENMALLTHERDLYYPLIEKIFKERDITFNLQGKHKENSFFIKAINDLLSLKDNHFSKEEIFTLLENPLILSHIKSNENDLNSFKRIIKEANVLYGFNEKHREQKGLPQRENNTWQKAFQRIYLGLVTNYNDPLKNKPPININFTEWNQIQPFIKFINQLYQEVSLFLKKEFTLEEWITQIQYFFSPLLDKEYTEEQTLRKTFSYIEKMTKNLSFEGINLSHHPFSFNFFKVFFEEVFSSFIPSSPKDKKGIKVGSYQTLGVSPHEITFICGMHHKNLFPKNPDSLDLHLKNKKEKELQTEREDFLRVIFQTEKKLILSYLKEDPLKTDKILYIQNRPPFLNEILSFLQESLEEPFSWKWESQNPLCQIIEKHPYWGFDRKYFQKEESFLSYNEKNFNMAQKKEKTKKVYPLENKEVELVLEEILYKEHNWQSLRYLLQNPYEKYFRETLNIPLNKLKPSYEIENHLEDYDPSSYFWISKFWEKMEEESACGEGIIAPLSWEKWENIYSDILEKEVYKDTLENNIYTSFNQKEWHTFLKETNHRMEGLLPFKRERINFQEGLEKEDVGKWVKDSFSLEGIFPYDIFRKEDGLFLVTYKKLYLEDLLLLLVLLSLYKYHVYPQKKEFIFREFYILQASIDLERAKVSFFWDEINEKPLEVIEEYEKLSHKKPLPFYTKILKHIISKNDYYDLTPEKLTLKLKEIFHSKKNDFNQSYYPECLYRENFPWEGEILEEDFLLFQKIYQVYQEITLPPTTKKRV